MYIFTYRALPPLRGSRPDVGSTPIESHTVAPIPRMAPSGFTAGLRQRDCQGHFQTLQGVFTFMPRKGPLCLITVPGAPSGWHSCGPAALFRRSVASSPCIPCDLDRARAHARTPSESVSYGSVHVCGCFVARNLITIASLSLLSVRARLCKLWSGCDPRGGEPVSFRENSGTQASLETDVATDIHTLVWLL